MGELMKREVQWVPVLLELVPGWFQVFGLGHLYQGRVGMGLFIMFSYWGLQVVNGFLTLFFGLGILTGFLTWLFYMVTAPMNANDHVKE
ncbi:MAG: hypothetical protein R3F61_32540 [Myxococcota bacterium]